MGVADIVRGVSRPDTPWALVLIPIIILLLLMRKKRYFSIPSRHVFEIERISRARRAFLFALRALPSLLVVLGIILAVLAFAGPQSVGMVSREVAVEGRVMVVINDVSGSMAGSNMTVLQSANNALLKEFCTKDGNEESSVLVGLVTFDDEASVRAHLFKDCGVIERRVSALETGGSTSIERGLWAGILLILNGVDRGDLVPAKELLEIQASLAERFPKFPSRRKEFCGKYQGLSIALFTDGDFPHVFRDRDSALENTQFNRAYENNINPFHVIDIAHALCIRTYFWSVQGILPAYREAFTTPPGMGAATEVGGMSGERLSLLYRNVAKIERGRRVMKLFVSQNPLRRLYITWAIILVSSGAFASVIPYCASITAHREEGDER
ncbi:MAG: hypothetical protein A2934_04860 [Candidatus Sungbacteria bacterium RIFCSPLOWO2_01_FULL_47_10]|uniref:VWFA domain-containing protein n=1 Tax=Candidatus Sungbacteria bacterium RIFCSPLOWO2_01_FULL_47_10 TaxID=1802276 RepID=A0A1G2L7H2_9BACT|nr:MAG: hypothetical protein A2934_04860 [Candidatus Sungbacteria bacterium RIFCSPLOWO2_01_FULL_47_10]